MCKRGNLVKVLRLFAFGALIISLVSGCISIPKPGGSDALKLAGQVGMELKYAPTASFTLAAYTAIKPGSAPVYVYLEGDGYAYVTRSMPSSNPTPRMPVALQLATEHLRRRPGDSVLYLARPCQYVPLAQEVLCHVAYWTHKRFAPEVIDAMDEALRTLINIHQPQGPIYLIGYSGGGAVALFIAARYPERVKSLVTVAGNVDHVAFNHHHRVPQLHGSLDPRSVVDNLKGIPQYHFIGSRDTVVPLTIFQSYRRFFRDVAPIKHEVVEGVGHNHGWQERWPTLMQKFLSDER